MNRTFLALCAFLFATQAGALSCLPSNLARTFNQLHEAPEIYRVAVGTLKLTSKVPKYVEGQPRSVRAEFEGQMVGRTALGPPVSFPVTLNAICLAHWCGGFPQNDNVEKLIFLQKSESGYVVDLGPCPTDSISVSSTDRIKTIQKCMRRGKCSNAQIGALERR